MAEEKKTLYKKLKDRHSQMKDVRRPYEDVRKEVIEMMRPELSLWDATDGESKGEKRNLEVFNGGPIEALQTWADGLQGHLASPSLDWFRYAMPDRELNSIPEVRKWLQAGEEVVYSVLRSSNFYSILNRAFRNAGSVGDGCMFIEENTALDGIVCSTFHPREPFVAEDQDGVINVFGREFYMTAANAAAKFGKDKLSLTLQENLKNNPQTRSIFLHYVIRRDDPIFDGESGIPDRPWVSVYIEVAAESADPKPARISGYFSYPAPYWRLEKASDTVYGWGLGCSALVDVFALNTVTMTNMRAGHMAVDPPMVGPMTMKGRRQIQPHGRTWVNPGDGAEIRPLVTNTNYPVGVDREERLKAAVEDYFDVPFFLQLARSERTKTATEIIELAGEKSILSGSKIGRVQSDLLGPVHDRVFEIAQNRGWIPEPPGILLDGSGQIEVQYLGPLAQAQRRLFETRRSQTTLAAIGPLVEANPEVLDWMDLDKTAVRVLRDGDWPEDEIRTEDQVNQMREARQQAAEAEQALAIAAEAGKLPGTAPEPGSPLDAAMAG